MALLVNDTVTDAVLVRVVMRGEIDSTLKLDDFASIVDGLAYLFHLAEVRERGIRAAADPIGPIHRSELHVRVARISYNSPLEFLLEMLNLPQWANYGCGGCRSSGAHSTHVCDGPVEVGRRLAEARRVAKGPRGSERNRDAERCVRTTTRSESNGVRVPS